MASVCLYPDEISSLLRTATRGQHPSAHPSEIDVIGKLASVVGFQSSNIKDTDNLCMVSPSLESLPNERALGTCVIRQIGGLSQSHLAQGNILEAVMECQEQLRPPSGGGRFSEDDVAEMVFKGSKRDIPADVIRAIARGENPF